MGCLKLNTEPEYNALKVVYSAASKSSRGSGKNGVETGYYYFGARYYDPRTSQWLSVDPLASKYPHASPYNYCEGNPVIYIDPDGNERIVVIGGADKGQQDRYKFINAGLGQAFKDGLSTIVLVTANMTKSEIDQVQKSVDAGNANIHGGRQGVKLVLVNSANEVVNYLNSKSSSNRNSSNDRANDKVTDLSVYGHGIPGSMEFGYDYVSGSKSDIEQNFSIGTSQVSSLNPNAFDNPLINLYTCNSATEINGYNLAQNISSVTSGTVNGYRGQSSYRGIYGVYDRIMKKLGINILPASNSPGSGQNATLKQYVNGIEK